MAPTLDPRREKLLIVHMDDMGSSHAANTAGQELFERGVVTSASVMVPCEWAYDFARWCVEHPMYDVGIHITLTCERRTIRWRGLTDSYSAPGLYDQDGFLHRSPADVAANADPGAAGREMERQVETALSWGLEPSHLDCHMGVVEKTPDLFDAYLGVAAKFGLVPHIPARVYDRPDLMGAAAAAGAPRLNERPPSDAGMAGDATYERRRAATYEYFESLTPGISVRTLHPNIDSPEIRRIMPEHSGARRSWKGRVDTYRLYLEEDTRLRAEAAGIRLVSWADVAE